MSKLSKAALAIHEALGDVVVNDDMSITVKDFNADEIICKEADVTVEQLSKIATTTKAINEALTDKVGRGMIEKFKEDESIVDLTYSHESTINTFGVDFVRPQKDAKASNSNFSSRLSVEGLDSTVDVIDGLVDLWNESPKWNETTK